MMKISIILTLSLTIGIFSLTACNISNTNSGKALTKQPWDLYELSGKPLISGSVITAEFSSGGKVNGSSGCNAYSGTYSISGKKIKFSDPMASTLKACEPGLMAQETAYLHALGNAKMFTVADNQLTLLDTSNNPLAKYKAQSQELAGTTWQVLSYNNGHQAVTSVLNGTSLTAVFSADGILSGVSGCNSYSGSYKIDSSQIKIGPLASTKKYCGNPSGVMDQETQYLVALESATKYIIEGNSLELRTGDGALAAQFIKNQ